MELQTHSLSTFDLHSNSSFSYSLNALSFPPSDIHSDQFCDSQAPGSSYSSPPLMDDPHCRHSSSNGRYSLGLGPTQKPVVSNALDGACPLTSAALQVQKVYRSYRTRRRLADSAVDELWGQAIDFARLNLSTISFFNFPESPASRWSRVKLNASKVGKGLSKDVKAQKLAFQHWIEAIDPRHRYGHNLHIYHEEWCNTKAGQPFFYWLDIGEGKNVDLEQCPRSKLRKQCIKYLGPQEREHYEYIVEEGKIIHKRSGDLLHTSKDSEGATTKWIFVMSTSKKLYAGQKKKGLFHHSSFLAGGATLAAGNLVAEHGILKSISAYSGHYRPTDDSLDTFVSYLKKNGVKLDEAEICKANEDSDTYEDGKLSERVATSEVSSTSEIPKPGNSEKAEFIPSSIKEAPQPEHASSFKRILSVGLQSPRSEVPKTAILQRINSKKAGKSYQLGHQVSLKWSTGAGPRIGCAADNPVELRAQPLEMLNHSPKFPPSPSSYWRISGLAFPPAHPAPDHTSSNCDGTYGN